MESSKKVSADSDIQLADSDVSLGGSEIPLADSNIALGKEPAKPAAKTDSKVAQMEELNLTLDQDLSLEDSSLAKGPAASGSALNLSGQSLDDDDLVLGGSGSGSDISIGGDSGISLVDPADSGLSLEEPLGLPASSEESLELGEDDLLAFAAASSPNLKTDDDFRLTPMPDAEADEAETGSQVIALDTEGETALVGGSGSMTAMLDEDLAATSSVAFGAPMPLAAAPLGAVASKPVAMAPGLPAMPAAAALPEAPYSILDVVLLVICASAHPGRHDDVRFAGAHAQFRFAALCQQFAVGLVPESDGEVIAAKA